MTDKTTEQIAKELTEKYEKLLYNKFTQNDEWAKCVNCALLGVDEIIKILQDSVREPIEFLEDLSKEIDKL